MISDDNLLFIFSLPRSGSTLLQRSLAAQAGFFTAPETWMLVKLMGGISGISEYSEYGGMWANKGASEFYNNERLGKMKKRLMMQRKRRKPHLRRKIITTLYFKVTSLPAIV